jgi:hypothetical protein
MTGSYDSLGTVTVPSGGISNITFTNIPTGYTHLQLRIQARGTSGAGGYYTSVATTFNNDTTAGNYYWHYMGGNGASAIWSSGSGYSTASLINIPNGTNTANAFAGGVIDIYDYASTNKYKTARSFNGADLNNSSGFPNSGAIFMASALWSSTSAITSITFTPDATYSTNFAAGSSFALYGVK